MFDLALVDQPCAVADVGVLVDNRPMQHDITADADRWAVRRPGGILVVIRPNQHGLADSRARLDMGADPDDAFVDLTLVEETPVADN